MKIQIQSLYFLKAEYLNGRAAEMNEKRKIDAKVTSKFLPNDQSKQSWKLVRQRKGIDKEMLALALEVSEKLDLGVCQERLTEDAQGIRLMLKDARSILLKQNSEELEALAVKLSHSALKLGARAMVGLCFSLQGWARRHDWCEAGQLVDELELEFLRVRDDLDVFPL